MESLNRLSQTPFSCFKGYENYLFNLKSSIFNERQVRTRIGGRLGDHWVLRGWNGSLDEGIRALDGYEGSWTGIKRPKLTHKPSNGKMIYPEPLHYKSDTWLAVVIIIFGDEKSFISHQKNMSVQHHVCLKSPWYACSQNDNKKGVRKQITDCVYHVYKSN